MISKKNKRENKMFNNKSRKIIIVKKRKEWCKHKIITLFTNKFQLEVKYLHLQMNLDKDHHV